MCIGIFLKLLRSQHAPLLRHVRVGAIQTVLTPFRDGIWNRRVVSGGDRGSFPHDPETVGDRVPTVPLLVSARIAIAVGILWSYVYDARPITNGSIL